MTKNKLKIETLIVGAGLTGLSTGYYLGKQNREFLIIESASRVGGVIDSGVEGDFIYETGPNAGVLVNRESYELFEELRSETCEVLYADKSTVMNRYISKSGQWHPLPCSFKSLLKTPLFSLKDKFGLLLEPFRKASTDDHQSVSEFIQRRLGKSILDYAIDPFTLGVYGGDPAQLSAEYAYPHLYQLEKESGSLFGGMLKRLKNRKTIDRFPHRGELFSFKGGMVNLTNELGRRVGEENIHLNSEITSVVCHGPKDFTVLFQKNGEVFEVQTRNLVLTCGADALEKLIPFVDSKRLATLTSCPYTEIIEIGVGFKNWQGMKLDGFGGLCPHHEGHKVLGTLFISTTLPERAPKGGALLVFFVGGVRQAELCQKSDDELVKIVAFECQKMLSLPEFNPELIKITRHKQAIPQYDLDCGSRFEEIKMLEHQFPGLKLAGDYIGGVGLTRRIAYAKQTVSSLTS